MDRGKEHQCQNCNQGNPDPGWKLNGRIIKDQKVSQQKRDHQKQDQPDDGCLLKILFKGFKKSFCNVAFLIPDQLQGHIIKRSQGSADGNYRNAADQSQNIQPDQICHFIQCVHNRTVKIKKFSQC